MNQTESMDSNSSLPPAGGTAIVSCPHARLERPSNPARALERATDFKCRSRTLNPTCFLNASACRDFLLDQAAQTRAHKFTRVWPKTLHALNELVRAAMIHHVRRLPSKGKTI